MKTSIALLLTTLTLTVSARRSAPCQYPNKMGKHRAGWGLDEPCEDFLKDYNKIKEVKKTTKKHIVHGPDSDKPRLFGVAHVKDYEDLVGLE